MVRMYKVVREQQQQIAEKNRKRREESATNVTFEVNDLVLLWEPSQARTRKAADDILVTTRKIPAKSKPKWTGPHKIVAVVPAGPRGGSRYSIEHLRTGTRTIHPNRLHLFNPWSETQPSTAPDAVDNRPYRIHGHAQPGAFIILPLCRPWPFGLAQLVRTDSEGLIY